MRYEARLARLERLLGKGAGNCPYCRLLRRHLWVDPVKPRPAPRDPSLVVYQKCPVCGEVKRLDLPDGSGGEPELYRIYLGAEHEDFYRDERTWAAKAWVEAVVAAEEAREEQQRERAGGQPHGLLAARRPGQKGGPERKLYDKLWVESKAYLKRVNKRLEAQYGKDPFPELAARLAAVTHVDREHLYADFKLRVPVWEMLQLQREEAAWLRCAEVERHVLGGVLAETQACIEDCERRALGMIEEARRQHEEYEEGERRRREEAERARREEGAPACAPPAPAAAADESPEALQRLYRRVAEFAPEYLPLIDTPDPVAPAPVPDDDRARLDREGARPDPGAPAAPAAALVSPRAETEELQSNLDRLLRRPGGARARLQRRYSTADETRYPWERRTKY